MFLYLCSNNVPFEEIAVINHSEHDIDILARELLDKNGKKTQIKLSEKRLNCLEIKNEITTSRD